MERICLLKQHEWNAAAPPPLALVVKTSCALLLNIGITKFTHAGSNWLFDFAFGALEMGGI